MTALPLIFGEVLSVKISVALCEGTHDIAFLSKILYANNFDRYKANISEYPSPLNQLFVRKFEEEQIADRKLGMHADSVFIPSVAMVKNGNLVLFHNMNGDSTTEERHKVIDQYNRLKEIPFLEEELNSMEFEYLIFYDADDIGVEGRINFIRDNFCRKYSIPEDEVGQAMKNGTGEIILGSYVFYDRGNVEKTGTLEDLLLRLMKSDNEEIFRNAQRYMDENTLPEDRTKFYFPNIDGYKGKKKFKSKKSLIAISGQLQFSGSDNAVIIAKSDYITQRDILNDQFCVEMKKLFTE